MTHLQRRRLRTFYRQIVYLSKYERDLEGIYLTRILPINLDRIGWQSTLQKMAKGNLGILIVRHLDFTVRTLLNFWISIAAHLHGTEEFCKPLHRTCVDNKHYSLLYIDVDIFQCQPLQICLQIAKNGMTSSCVTL
jgi:hypothetical protein